MKMIKLEKINTYLTPQKLNYCKYDLIVYGKVISTIITRSINREDALVTLIKKAYERAGILQKKYNMAFKIMLTEDGIKQVFVDSKTDVEFIKFIYGKV